MNAASTVLALASEVTDLPNTGVMTSADAGVATPTRAAATSAPVVKVRIVIVTIPATCIPGVVDTLTYLRIA